MIKQISTIALVAIAAIAFTGCSGEKKATEVKTYKYSTTEVYEKSCSKCHGLNGEGNVEKKTPALNDRTAGEMAQDLFDVKNGGTNQSSGTDHEIMEHNMQKLVDKGFDYDINSMAEYMSKLSKK
ncbi:MAG: c-type cytochrome [Sulfurimonas sp.]|uniref:c-type cytochrome n=1 Tax=Sulfurimonas sp. TaxID=2022749 RepID=UPI0025E58609|nr:c-type cytochrome [Sulfurimonas sp.]MCK9492040.1 c-type cytochrome [Sulfurimonas sp.]